MEGTWDVSHTMKRFRSNVYGKKQKEPLSFQLPKRGHVLLRRAQRMRKMSRGDIVMELLDEKYGAKEEAAAGPA